MAPKNIVEIVIQGFDKASKPIDNVSKSTAQLGKQSKTTTQSMMKLGAKLATVAATVIGFGVAMKKALDLSKAGAAVQQTGESFDLLMKKVGASSDHLEQLKIAARGTISDMDLMSSTATLLAGAQGELAKELAAATPQLLEIAKASNKLNPALGSTTFLYNSLATGVKRASPLILDNLGLTIKIGQANQAYADALGKSVSELTANEQKQALLNETLRAGRVLIEQAGGSTESATDSYEILAANTANLKDITQQMMHEAFEPWVDVLAELSEIIVKNSEANINFADTSRELMAMASGLAGVQSTEIDRMGRLILVYEDGTKEYAKNAEAILAMKSSIEQADQAMLGAIDVMMGMRNVTEEATEAAFDLTEIQNLIAQDLGETNSEIQFYEKALEEAILATEELAESTGNYSEETEFSRRKVRAINEALVASKKKFKEVGKTALTVAQKGIRPYTISVMESAIAMQGAMDGFDDYMGLLRGGLMPLMSDLINVNDLWGLQFSEFETMFDDANESVEEYSDGVEKLTKTTTDNTYANQINREAQQLHAIAVGQSTEEIVAMENELFRMTTDLKENGEASGITAAMISELTLRIARAKEQLNNSASAQNAFIQRTNNMTEATIRHWEALGKQGARLPGQAGGPPPGEEMDPAEWAKKQGYQQGAKGRSAVGHAADVWKDLADRHELDLKGPHTAGWALEFMRSGAGTGLASTFSEHEIQEGLKDAIKHRMKAGGSFMVPPGFRNDDYLVGVSSGERVAVTPAHASTVGGAKMVIQNLNVYGVQTDQQLYEAVTKVARQRGRDFAHIT